MPSNATAPADGHVTWDPRAQERTTRLFRRLRRFGDTAARDQLIELYMPLARRLALRHTGSREPFDDMMQVAVVGLILAVDRFDPERGIPFAGFAKPTIAGELKRHLRDHAWCLHVPRELQDRALRVVGAADRLSGRGSVSESLEELAAHCKITVDEAAEAIAAWHAYTPDSLDVPDPESPSRLRVESSGARDPGYVKVEHLSVISQALAALSPTEQTILALRFGADLSQTEIAERVGISQMHVSRLLGRALARLEVVVRANG
ncbi:MAG TPA: sigma-70 family RNA polymerase sigma factor [Thermoleophilaceae bacterium]